MKKVVLGAALALAVTVAVPSLAVADGGKCPDVVKTAVDKAYPGATITKCKHETEDGHEQFEVKLTRKVGGALEVDVSLDGKILQTEEVVAIADVPDAVMKALAAKYPKAKPTRAEKQTQADGSTSYELAFTGDKGRRVEATFTADGKFVEQE